MKTFKQFINEQKEYLIMGGDTKKAYDMERVIVSAVGGENFVSDSVSYTHLTLPTTEYV